jgi:hypothetical protein
MVSREWYIELSSKKRGLHKYVSVFLGPCVNEVESMIHTWGAFTRDVKLMLNENLGNILSGMQC